MNFLAGLMCSGWQPWGCTNMVTERIGGSHTLVASLGPPLIDMAVESGWRVGAHPDNKDMGAAWCPRCTERLKEREHAAGR